MKIKAIKYKVFGKLEDMELNFGDALNVVFGRNEAGKSTIFNSIKTLIYGFKPSNRDKHPYTHWEKNEIQFTGEIEDHTELFAVERSLKSVPKFNLLNKKEGNVQTFRNEALPSVKNVSEMLYESVFHLTADDLGNFEKDSWETIQENLIFNYGTDYLIKTTEVIGKLEQDINALWRKDKRGNPLINQIQSDIGLLKQKRHEVEKVYDTVKLKTERLEQIEGDLKELSDRKGALERKLSQYREALPVKELREKIDSLYKSVYNIAVYEKMNPKIIEEMGHYKRRLSENESRKQETEKQLSLLDQTMITYSQQDLRLLELMEDHDYLKGSLDDMMKLEHEAHLMLDDLMKSKEKSNNQFKLLFGDALSDEKKQSLRQVQVLDVMSSLQKYAEYAQKNIEIEKRLKLMHDANGKMMLLIGVSGIVLVSIGVLTPLSFLSFLGFAMLGYSVAKYKPASKDSDQTLYDLTSLEDSIRIAMQQIELPEYVWGDDCQRFLGKLESLIMMLYEEESIEKKWMDILAREKTLESEIQNHLNDYGIDSTRGTKLTLQYTLAQMEHLSAVESGEHKKRLKRETLLDALKDIEKERLALASPMEQLVDEITAFGGGDYDFGESQITQNHENMVKIKLYEDELKRNLPDDLLALDVSKEQIEALDIERKRLYELEKAMIEEKHIVMNALKAAREKMNLDDIDSEILMKEEQLIELIATRDRLMVLNEIVKFSDEMFRRQNQPNIMNRVSYFMSRMTKGKYSEVLIDEKMSLQFLVSGELLPISKAFSKGTIQQLFLAYRLAIIESLDPTGALPLVLDEAFVNWDGHRFKETAELICELSRKRQIFVFTCHNYIAAEFEGYPEASRQEVTI